MRNITNGNENSKDMQVNAGVKPGTVVILIMGTIIVMMALTLYIGFFATGRSKDSYVSESQKLVKTIASTEPEINIRSLNHELREMGELTTVDKTYNYSMEYKDGKIPLFTKHSFTMDYSVQVRVGVDLTQVRARVRNGVVYISIPDVKEQVFHVDPHSVYLHDEHHALFDGDGKEDLQNAYSLAEEDARGKVDTVSLYALAENNAETIICNLVEEIVGREVEVIIE